jgi:hypothetical protein
MFKHVMNVVIGVKAQAVNLSITIDIPFGGRNCRNNNKLAQHAIAVVGKRKNLE